VPSYPNYYPRIVIYLNPRFRQLVRRTAAADGTTVSGWFRDLAAHRIAEVEGIDYDELLPQFNLMPGGRYKRHNRLSWEDANDLAITDTN
jgi:hypothetical protein